MVVKFYDTSALLNTDTDTLMESKFCISEVSLLELEDIKTNKNKDAFIKLKAKNVSKFLEENHNMYTCYLYRKALAEDLAEYNLQESPDNMICVTALAVAKYGIEDNDELVFVSDDLNHRLIARDIFGLNVCKSENKEEKIYKGYKLISGTSNEINNAMQNIYESNYNKWSTNEYLLIHNTDDNSDKEMRFNGTQFVPLKLPNSKYIKGKNPLQRCALDILNNPDITIAAILGGYGSGKTALTMKMALYAVQEKGLQSQIIGVRSPTGEGVQIGWLPGDFSSKTDSFWKPMEQQLEGGEFELERLLQVGVLRTEIPFYLKGQTLNGIILVDEAEDLTKKELRLVGTRIGENSRIFLNGDYKQSVVSSNSDGNALIQMCNSFKGNPMFGCIYLDEDVRSNTSKMFAKLFE